MFERALLVLVLSSSSLSRASTFSLSLSTCFSVLLINIHDVGTAED